MFAEASLLACGQLSVQEDLRSPNRSILTSCFMFPLCLKDSQTHCGTKVTFIFHLNVKSPATIKCVPPRRYVCTQGETISFRFTEETAKTRPLVAEQGALLPAFTSV